MATNLKPYPSYKPSGVEWLGEVPAHWEVRRVKHAFRRIVGGSTPLSNEMAYWDGTIIWVTPTDIGRVTRLRDSLRRITRKGFDSCSATLVPVGSLVVTSRAPVGNVALAEVPLCTNQGCKALVPDSQVIASAYGYQVFGILKDELQSLANGTTFTEISTNALGNVLLPIPPLPEQAAIVRYLDHTDGRIRRYLRSRKRLIELLKEYRQAVVHEAVTRGLDPDVSLKPSGVEWLGDVPTHWEVRRLRYAVKMKVSNVDKHSKDEELPVRLCNYVDVYKNDRITERVPFMRATAKVDEMDRFRLEIGDVLITKDSEVWNDIGVPAFVEYSARDLVCGYHLALLRSMKSVLNGAYLFYSLQSSAIASQFHIAANGVTRYGLSHHAIKSALLPIPSLAEQAAIVRYLDKQTAAIDAAMARAQQEIELLSEYRIRLIADVVTGQVDVREAAELSYLGQGDSTKGDGGEGS